MFTLYVVAFACLTVGVFLGILIENKSLAVYLKKTKKEISSRDSIIASLNTQIMYIRDGRVNKEY
jgi:hypothetical protein